MSFFRENGSTGTLIASLPVNDARELVEDNNLKKQLRRLMREHKPAEIALALAEVCTDKAQSLGGPSLFGDSESDCLLELAESLKTAVKGF